MMRWISTIHNLDAPSLTQADITNRRNLKFLIGESAREENSKRIKTIWSDGTYSERVDKWTLR